jgi:UDP-GlcNAc:undecaprenyl-phosphate GlcNAc-1-phosphate transferase
MIYFSSLLFSLFITTALIPLLTRLAARMYAFDIPGPRKVHDRPIPKSGGIAMALGIVLPLAFWAPETAFLRTVLLGSGLIVFFGIMDDLKDLAYGWKFAGQTGAALLVILAGDVQIRSVGMLLPDGVLLPPWVSLPLTLVVIVGVTNAINLADGLDGLAGGISMLSFVFIGYLALQTGQSQVALAAAAAVGAIFGFLHFNTHPAILFMGDTGSQLLGFMAITMSLHLTQSNEPLSPLLPLILVGFPVLDTLVVMSERVAAGRSPFLPDKNHFHHKLMRIGLYHPEAVFVIYVIQSFLVTAAYAFRYANEWFILAFYLVFSSLIVFGFLLADRANWELKRYDFLDVAIKGRLRVLREKNILIRVSFKVLEYGLPAVLMLTCFFPARIPTYLSVLALGLCLIVFLTLVFRRARLGGLLRLAIYITVPLVLYLAEVEPLSWLNPWMVQPYNISFAVLVLSVLLTLKFTRRKKGFRSTPMDFLILFLALVVPNFPNEYLDAHHVGSIAARIIVLFFGFEILIGELRGELIWLTVCTFSALAIVGIRGVV